MPSLVIVGFFLNVVVPQRGSLIVFCAFAHKVFPLDSSVYFFYFGENAGIAALRLTLRVYPPAPRGVKSSSDGGFGKSVNEDFYFNFY